MRGQYEELSCPFCDKGKIQCWYIPGAISIKRSGARSLPGKFSKTKSSDVWIVKSGCNVCGKSLEEIEQKLKEEGII
ncbi:MAG: hypothetical protein KQA38_03550 [Candidatus Aenigmarchaeota archaeon]|nr:hypothetical protein [Candidatus Aenigmarchaeota archaeon]